MEIKPIGTDDRDVAPTTNAGFMSGFTSGFAHKTSAFCPPCAADKTVSVNGDSMSMPDAAEVFGDGRHVVNFIQTSTVASEPGIRCDECGRFLNTHIIHRDV